MVFYKYHGAGNDFILVDNRAESITLSTAQVAFLCNRHFGIGADGLMLLELAYGYDFRMVYFNSDGREASMCGNGGRCIVAFAHRLGMTGMATNFIAVDGEHSATIRHDGLISLQMKDVAKVSLFDGYAVLDTGSLHYVHWVDDVDEVDVFHDGRKIRNRPEYKADGINVNYVQLHDGKLRVRTYERGVEDETLSCGTGVTAAAIASTAKFTGTFNTEIETPGGRLEVSFVKDSENTATDVVLTGPAEFVFKGEIELPE